MMPIWPARCGGQAVNGFCSGIFQNLLKGESRNVVASVHNDHAVVFHAFPDIPALVQRLHKGNIHNRGEPILSACQVTDDFPFSFSPPFHRQLGKGFVDDQKLGKALASL